MKKIIGILGVAVIAVAMFLNVNAVHGSANDTSLASLLKMNLVNASAEGTVEHKSCNDVCYALLFHTCSWLDLDDDARQITITCSDMAKR